LIFASGPRDDYFSSPQRYTHEVVVMIAVIGNVLAGLGVVSLFTATLRLTKPR
jgi:hypothetical protein